MLNDSLLLPNQAVVPLGTALLYIALCIHLLFHRKFDEPLDRLFVVYLLFAALWNINLTAAVDRAPTLWPTFSWGQLAPYGMIILGVVYWALARTFLQLPWKEPWGWAMAGVGIALLIAVDAGWLVTPLEGLGINLTGSSVEAIIFDLASLWWVVFTILALVVIVVQHSQTQSPSHKNRIQYLIISTVLLIIGYGMYLSLQEPLWTAGLIVAWFGAVLISYIVVAEDPIDLGVGLRRALRALVIALVTVIVYIAGIELVHIFLGDFLSSIFLSRFVDRSLLVAVVAAVLLTVVYTPIREISQRIVNHVLFGQHYDFRAVIHNYSQGISNILYLGELANVAMDHIDKTLGVDRGALFVVEAEMAEHLHLRSLPAMGANDLPKSLVLSKNTPITWRLVEERQAVAQYAIDLSPHFKAVPEAEREALHALNFEWFIPVLKKEQLVGLLALGPKRSGQAYNSQDIRLLNTLADQTGLALENAALFDRVQRNLEEISRMKNLMDNVFDSIDNGVITTDIEGKITLFNRAAETILATSSQRCIGFPYTQALPSLANTVLGNLMRNVTGREYHYSNYEFSSELPDRGKVELSFNLAPLKDAQNLTQGVTIVVDDLTETKRLRAVHNIFRRYVSPAVVDRLPANPDDLQLGGHRQQVTILFADIRGFTSYSEKLDPEELVDTLNQYLSIAASSVLMYEGTLDKFMGDALMGIFNAPLEQEDHVLRAVRAAAAMQRALAEYHSSISQKRRLSFGVGLHVGEVVVGNVGMSDRMDYTAIGDAVNLAKRIQENAPGNTVLMSEAVYQTVKDVIEADFYRKMQVKGREEPVVTYKLRFDA